MSNETATFTLSQEEVYFLLQQIRAKGLLGLDMGPFDALDSAQRHVVLDIANRALAARGILVAGPDGEPFLDSAVRATIHAAAFANWSLAALVRRDGTAEMESYILHHTEPLWIEHIQPGPGLHQFTLSVERPAADTRLEQLLGVEAQPAPDGAPFTIDQAELERIKAVLGEPEALSAMLRESGADDATAQHFGAVLADPQKSAIIQAIDRRNEAAATHTVTLFGNPDGFWMLKSTDPDNLLCQPASADDVRHVLADLLEQL
jgi:hypothetical protein